MSECTDNPELEALRQERDQLRASLSEADRERREAQDAALGGQTLVDSLRAELAAMKERAEKAESDISAVCCAGRLEVQKLCEAEERASRALAERDSARAELAAERDAKYRALTCAADYSGELTAARAELAAMKRTCDSATAAAARERAEHGHTEKALAAERERRESLRNEYDRLHACDTRHMAEADTARARVTVLEGLVRSLRNGVQKALDQEILDAAWRMQAQEFVKQATAALAGGEVGGGVNGLQLHTVTYVRCPACGYQRYLPDSEAANWRLGEHASGSQKCPACSGGESISAAQWRANTGNPIFQGAQS